MATQKTLSRAYTFQRKVWTPESTDVPDELLKRDAEYVAAKAGKIEEKPAAAAAPAGKKK